MTPEEFRKAGREVIDWIADYYERVGEFPVMSQVAPGDIRSKLPDNPPHEGEAFGDVMRDIEDIILPAPQTRGSNIDMRVHAYIYI